MAGVEEDHADLEVATVLARGLGAEGTGSNLRTAVYSSSSSAVPQGSALATYSQSPYRASTVLTNVSRGNTATVTPSVSYMTIHLLAAQGELIALKSELEDFNHDIDSRDEDGLTPLAWAAAYNQSDTVAYLLQQGANPDSRGDQSETPLMLASMRGHDAIVNMLLKQGVEVNAASKDQNSSLLYAAYGNHPKCVSALLIWGADMSHSNAQHVTALDVAVHWGYKEVQAVLEKHLLSILDPT